MRRLTGCKRGLTLMEILVGGMLFGMIVLTVSAVLAPMMRSARIANDFAEFSHILDSVANTITSEMSQSVISVAGTGTNSVTMIQDSATIVLSIDNGTLQRSVNTAPATPVFPLNFYRGKTIEFVVTGTAPDYTVTVTIASDGAIGTAAIRERTYAVRPLLMTNAPPGP